MIASKTLMLLAAITKRAQLPFSAWLPAAIAAPTPTSSLVHSSTLVTAGVWLINRFTMVTKAAQTSRALIASAIMTTIMAGITATKEKDIKKIVAMSTLSQLGIIIMVTALRMKKVTMLHTNVHALFRALLFITVGRMMEKKEGSQKKRGITRQERKITMTALKASLVTLIRLPMTSRFFSKDVILETIIQKAKAIEALSITATAVLTMKYSITIIKELSRKKRASERKESKAKRGEFIMGSAMVITRTLMSNVTDIGLTATNQKERAL